MENVPANPEIAPHRPVSKDGRLALLFAAVYLAFYQITAIVHYDSFPVITLSTLISLIITLCCVVSIARALHSWRSIAVVLIGSSVAMAALALLKVSILGLGDLLLMGLAASFGVLLSRLVREMKILLPIAIVLALVDLYVVFGGGLVKQAQEGNKTAQVMMQNLTVGLPTVQETPKPNAAPMKAYVGFADYLFIALFFACFLRFGVPSRRTFVVLCVTLAAYMGYVIVTNTALPALVPIAVVIVLFNLKAFRYERAEAFALLYAGLLITAILGGMLYFSRR